MWAETFRLAVVIGLSERAVRLHAQPANNWNPRAQITGLSGHVRQLACAAMMPWCESLGAGPGRSRLGIEVSAAALERSFPFECTVDVALGQSWRQVTARHKRLRPSGGYVAELVANWRSLGNTPEIAWMGDISARDTRDDS